MRSHVDRRSSSSSYSSSSSSSYDSDDEPTTPTHRTIAVTRKRDHPKRPCIVVITMGPSDKNTEAFLDTASRIAVDHTCSLMTIEVKGKSTEPVHVQRDDIPKDAIVFLVSTDADKTQANELMDTLLEQGIAISRNTPLDPSRHLFVLESLPDLLQQPQDLLPRQADSSPPPEFGTIPSIQDFYWDNQLEGETIEQTIARLNHQQN